MVLAESLRVVDLPAPSATPTSHVLRLGDARSMDWLSAESIHLAVTSPPYWTLKKYNDHPDQLGDLADYKMKIEYVGNFSQPHCTEVHIALTLEELGHEVIRIQEDKPDDDYIDIASNCDLFLFTRTWGNLVTLDGLQQIREAGVPSASYHLDLYVGLKRQAGLNNDPFWRTDYVFTPDGDLESHKVFESKGINHHYMRPGVYRGDCYLASPVPGIGNDVIFVGSGTSDGKNYHGEWPYRFKLLKYLETMYESQYTKYGHPEETIRNKELNELYASSKVVVGDSTCIGFKHTNYWSDRAYETLGRGGFLIHPYIKGMEEEFVDGQSIVFYEFNNWDELKDKIDYYLEHPAQRKAIMMNGHNLVKRKYTYHNRLSQMLKIVFPDYDPKQEVKKRIKLRKREKMNYKINLGAGGDIFDGYINVDLLKLPGIDKVHNLMYFPYPFPDESATHIRAVDVIEHLDHYTKKEEPTIIKFIEECWRILKPGGELYIQTPGWNADFMWIDPTHVRGFHKESMDFFDPTKPYGQTTGFYSKCKFNVRVEELENHNLRFYMEKI